MFYKLIKVEEGNKDEQQTFLSKFYNQTNQNIYVDVRTLCTVQCTPGIIQCILIMYYIMHSIHYVYKV